ncbi:alpha-ketoglutarate-dependent dioxygenase FTO isoform X1 [Amia ocellicauda]|uniref:alpha-ketoglutarate-dependent dioxygenase FTO isoform X1 n=1 Tax=Amia ocellicauda TaxID=2972642 RepID=UPI003463B0DE
MKRSDASVKEKEIKRQKLLQDLEGRQIPFLTPRDAGFQQLWCSRYSSLAVQRAEEGAVPRGLHEAVQAALSMLLQRGCFLRDLVRIRERDVFTAVSRVLLGRPGLTYKYLGTRLFALPWEAEGSGSGYSDRELSTACQAFEELNCYFCTEVESGMMRDRAKEEEDGAAGQRDSLSSAQADVGTAPFCSRTQLNVTLLNYMDPAQMSYLKEEPYFGMGRMAVSWHHDEGLVPGSPVAVYSYSCGGSADAGSAESVEDGGGWAVGLKVAWDIHTPGLMVPLGSGDCYYMLDDLNTTHQHCVLAGQSARFSSTHRAAECSTGTLGYIQRRSRAALDNLLTDPVSGSKTLHSVEPSALRRCEEIHNEVEFEWLRQYWFQGRRFEKFCSWWSQPMQKLEEAWREMETMTQLALAVVDKEGRLDKKSRREAAEALLPIIAERQELRQLWRTRCQSRLAQTLPADEAPMFHPYWRDHDPSLPLPFDLKTIIQTLESLL